MLVFYYPDLFYRWTTGEIGESHRTLEKSFASINVNFINRDFDYAKSWILSILSPLWQSGEESGNCSWEIKKC